jgi:peroxiredoxin
MTDLQESLLPWVNTFATLLAVVQVGIIACALWGLIAKRGAERKRWLLRVGAVFLVWIALVGGYYWATFSVYLPKPSDVANNPGTLTRIGQPAPDFSLRTLEGKVFVLSEQRGRVVLLNFFATWCGPCQEELPQLQRVWDEFRKSDGFSMLVIARGESVEKVRAFHAKQGFQFPMAADSEGSAYRRFAKERIPRTYLISRDGTILYQCTGYYVTEHAKLKALIRTELKATVQR